MQGSPTSPASSMTSAEHSLWDGVRPGLAYIRKHCSTSSCCLWNQPQAQPLQCTKTAEAMRTRDQEPTFPFPASRLAVHLQQGMYTGSYMLKSARGSARTQAKAPKVPQSTFPTHYQMGECHTEWGQMDCGHQDLLQAHHTYVIPVAPLPTLHLALLQHFQKLLSPKRRKITLR